MNVRTRVATTVLGIAVIAAACDQASTSPDGVRGPQQFVGAVGTTFPISSLPDPLDLGENYVICKDGPTSTFNVTANGSAVSGSPFTVASDMCKVVYEHSGVTETVASSEIVPAGVQLDQVVMTQLTCKLGQGSNCPAVFPVVTGPTTVFTGPLAGPTTSSAFSGYVGGTAGSEGLSGVLIVYSNSEIPGGGEGCTPGYWKNHAGIYSFSTGGKKKPSMWIGYSPTQYYDTVFGVTSKFGATFTLIAALADGGGSEDALARHAVSALLNAANPSVDYDLSVAQVIALVQSAYASGNFEGVKNILAGYNEQTCPIDNGL